MVPGLHADPLVDALALPLPAGARSRTTTWSPSNAPRGPATSREYELVDTGVFDDDRYWAVTVDYAKAGPTDLCVRDHASTNRGPEAATLHVLPTLWFRNTWAWGLPGARRGARRIAGRRRRGWSPSTAARPAGRWPATASRTPLLLRQRDQHRAAVGRARPLAVPEGRHQRPRGARRATVNPDRVGTKGALHYVLTCRPGETARDAAAAGRAGDGRRAAPDLGDGVRRT